MVALSALVTVSATAQKIPPNPPLQKGGGGEAGRNDDQGRPFAAPRNSYAPSSNKAQLGEATSILTLGGKQSFPPVSTQAEPGHQRPGGGLRTSVPGSAWDRKAWKLCFPSRAEV